MNQDEMIAIFTAERHVLMGYIMAIVRDYALAEDVYQETAVAIVKGLNGFDPSRDFRGYIRGIARNMAKKALTRVSREQAFSSEQMEVLVSQAYEEQTEDTWYVLARYQTYLADCMGRLTGWARTAIRLRYSENLSLESIGRNLGRSPGAVQVGLSRARSFLHGCLEKKWLLEQAMGRES
ncbi:MAG: sigma-70 family RNA polymerase sigma factor [bacterium]